MIVLIGGEKGGTGKSTLATNLAAWLARAKRDVILVDADRQKTSANWVTERCENSDLPEVHCVERHGNLFHTINDLRRRYEDVLIDAGGRDSEELRTAMTVADKIYSPMKASQADLWTVEHLSNLVTLAKALNPKLESYFLISMAPTNPRISEKNDAKEMLKAFQGIEQTKIVIHERKAYRDALGEGRGVIEMGDSKAAQEVDILAREVYDGQI